MNNVKLWYGMWKGVPTAAGAANPRAPQSATPSLNLSEKLPAR